MVAPARLGTREKVSYGLGEVASNLSWNMAAGFLLVYYTDVALLPVAALGTLMLVTRVFDAIFDPLVGIMVDRTRTRFGRTRPYLIFGTVPFALLCVATFSVPDASPALKVAYAYVSFTLLGLGYSLLYIPYSAMLPLMTRDPAEKVQLGTLRSAGTSIGSMIAYSLVLPLVALGSSGGGQHAGYAFAAAVLAVLTGLCYWIVVANCCERYVAEADRPAASFFAGVGQLVRNRLWWVVFVWALLIFIRLGIMVSSLAFFAKDVLARPAILAALLPFLSVAILCGTAVAGLLFSRVSKRTGNYMAIAFAASIYLLMPLAEGRPMVFVLMFLLANATGGIQGTTMFIAAADAVEYHEARFGTPIEGLLASSTSFGTKVGFAIGAAICAYALAWGGYVPSNVDAGAKHAIRLLFYAAPLAILFLQAVCISFYDHDATPRNLGKAAAL